MNRLYAEDVTIRPLFYDALSGNFHPPKDPFGHAHKLSRLIVATTQKGTDSLDRETILTNVTYTYLPEWASGVTSKVDAIIPGEQSLAIVAGMHLHDESGEHSLSVEDVVDDDGHHLRLASELQGIGNYYPLELGKKLHVARLAVANAAQKFFNEAAQPHPKTIL